MGCKFGIIGLPNVGKSTLFNMLTQSNVRADNFPFCTIKPNIGIVSVFDERLNRLSEIVKVRHVLPATMEFVDVAGLVKGASQGNGLGNQFLMNIRATEAIGHVVRCFKNENTIHILGKINPIEDIDIVNTELALSDLEICERAIHLLSKKNQNDKKTEIELEVLEKCLLQLKTVGMLRLFDLKKEEKEVIRHLNFLTLKPIMYIANINKDSFEKNLYLDQVYAVATRENTIVVPVCAIVETNSSNLCEEEGKQDIFIKELNSVDSRSQKIVRASYTLLNLQTYFTIGKKEIRAWPITIGSTALQAARKIHTDLEKGFIKAKVISYEDFITYEGEQGAKEAGKIRTEGKDYVVKDGDILNFLFKV